MPLNHNTTLNPSNYKTKEDLNNYRVEVFEILIN